MKKSAAKALEFMANNACSEFFNLLPDLISQSNQSGPALDIATYLAAFGGITTIQLVTPPILGFQSAGLELRITGAAGTETITLTPSNSTAKPASLSSSTPTGTGTVNSGGNFVTITLYCSKYLIIDLAGLTVGKIVEMSLVVKR